MNSLTRLRTFAAVVAVALGAAPLLAADASSTDRTPAVATVPNTRPAPLRLVAAETRYWERLADLLGSGDRRKLAEARTRFTLQSAFFHDPLADPFYDRTRNTVRDGYVTLYKEVMRRQFVNGLLDDTIRHRFGDGEIGGSHSPWSVRIDPRLSVGHNGSIGANFYLPHATFAPLKSMSFIVRRDVSDGGTVVGLRYDKGKRFWQLEHISGDPAIGGEQVDMSVALRF